MAARQGIRAAVTIGALALAGCAHDLGIVSGLLGSESYPPAMVLATGVVGEDCASSLLGWPAPTVAGALARAVASVPDATLLVDARVETRTLVTGIYNRRCVRVRGSAARLVSSVVVEHAGGHAHHHGAE